MSKLSDIISRLKRSKLFSDSLWALLGSAAGKGLALMAGIIVARLLGSEEFGEYGLIRNTITYIAIVSTFGLGYSATKYVAEYAIKRPHDIETLIKTILKITLLTSLGFTLLPIIFAKQLSQFIVAPHLEEVIRNCSLLIIVNALTTTQLAILSGLKKFKITAKINTVTGVSVFIFSCVGTYLGGLPGALLALLISFIFQIIISQREIIKAIKEYHNCTKSNIDRAEIKAIMAFSLPIALQDSLYAITHWLSAFIIISLSDYHEMGLISAATTWQSIVIFIPAMLKNVMFSYLASAHDHKTLVNKFLLISLVSTIIPVLIISLGSHIIANFYGASFAGLNLVIIVMCISAVIISLGEVYAFELLSEGHSWMVFISRIIRDLLTLVCSYLVLLKISSNYALMYSLLALTAHIVYLIIIRYLYGLCQFKNV